MKNSYENMEDMQRMQEEAIRRVREMQKRAQQTLSAGNRQNETKQQNNVDTTEPKISDGENQNKTPEKTNPTTIIVPEKKDELKLNHENKNLRSKNKSDFFSELLNDHEKTLILLLILLLIDEQSDMFLVMALMYLLI